MIVRKKKTPRSIEELEIRTRSQVGQADVAFNAMLNRHTCAMNELLDCFTAKLIAMRAEQELEIKEAKRRLASITEDMISELPKVLESEVTKSRNDTLADDAKGDFDALFNLVLVEADAKHKVKRSQVRARICELAKYNPEVEALVEKYRLRSVASLGSRAFLDYLTERATNVTLIDGAAVLHGVEWADV